MLNICHVSKRWSREFAVKNITLNIQKGEVLSLLGPSGSGKSTVLGVVGGWLSADKGRVIINGTDYTNIPAGQRPVRTCFQKGKYLFPHMTTAENVEYPLRLRRVSGVDRRRRRSELFSRLGLDGLEHRRPDNISGGEAQRVALARAVADLQPVLLLDEIQAGLDPTLRSEVLAFVLDLAAKEQTTILYVTHQANEAFSLADRSESRIAVLNAGVLEQVDRPRTLYYHPISRNVASLTGDVLWIPMSNPLAATFGHHRKPIEGLMMVRPHELSLIFLSNADQFTGNLVKMEFEGDRVDWVVKFDGTHLRIPAVDKSDHPKIGSRIPFWAQPISLG